jgi:hypothetical protein
MTHHLLTDNQRPREYDPDDKVTITIQQGNRLLSKEFLIDTFRDNYGRWEYQLKDKLTGAQWDSGRWFGEGELSFAY